MRMRSQPPTVSVIIPAWNAEKYLAESLASVTAQTLASHEIIVVDDGSTDGTVDLAATIPGVRVMGIAHAGIGAARNAGVREASGDLLAFLDADDRWSPDKLARQVQVLIDEPSVDLVLGHVLQFLSPDLDEARRKQLRCPEHPQPGLLAGTMVIRAAAFNRVGLFNPALAVGEFIDWYARASEAGLRVRMVPEVVLHRRVHGGNTVLRERDKQSDYVRIVKAALDRRRANPDRS